MFPEDLKIDFRNFQPSLDMRRRLSDLARGLHMDSPSDATLRASFEKVGQLFEGAVRVSSAVGTFLAKAQHSDLSQVAEQLASRLQDQLRHWKHNRVLIGSSES